MATGPVSEILFRSGIAAVNSTDHLRVYTQDVNGNIRESLYESKWTGGTIKNVIAQGKIGSPIAAISRVLDIIYVYYISTSNKLCEQVYSESTGWQPGHLTDNKITVAPYSKIAACFLGDSYSELRVYFQLPDNTIQEYGCTVGRTAWSKMSNLGAALTGTEIACTSYQTSELSIRTYFQDPSLNLIEKAYDAGRGWFTGAFSVKSALPRTAIASTSFTSPSSVISLRVYYAAPNNRLLEKAHDGGSWYDGGFSQPCIPGSEVAVIHWGTGNGLNLRVYFQNGTDVTGVSEWVWNGSWSQGVKAIPPA